MTPALLTRAVIDGFDEFTGPRLVIAAADSFGLVVGIKDKDRKAAVARISKAIQSLNPGSRSRAGEGGRKGQEVESSRDSEAVSQG